MVEREGSFSRVGVVGESRRDLGERREEVEVEVERDVGRREEGEERMGGRTEGLYGEEEGRW